MFLNRKISFVAGIICGLSFAPVYFIPGIFTLSVLCAQISAAANYKQAAKFGYLFGFGFFLSTLYWISFGVSVYIEQFWWAIPFALFGLPAFLALFISAHSALAWLFRKTYLYHFIFCCIWLFTEWLMSWIFTGLPWGMLGYAFSISDIMIQPASIFGILGLSFIALYVGSSLFSKKALFPRLTTSIILCVMMIIFGYNRLQQNPTEFSELKIRIVQPSTPQTEKWAPETFWKNLNDQVELSQKPGDPDIIVWSEAALTAPYYYKPIHNSLMSIFTKDRQVILSGGVNDNAKQGDEYEIYSSLIAINSDGKLLFDYHKSHLVPFGEYMPLANYIPIKKLTPGILAYTPGTRKIMHLKPFHLYIHPLICYESIFAEEVKISNSEADIILNVTNDAWYGSSSGPYQHFEISRVRSVENGLPMIRAANNGISAIIDPVGRTLHRLELNQVDILDGNMPLKLLLPTIYSEWGNLALSLWVLFVLILQSMIALLYLRFPKG
ncbi:MAG: apolipoprotein N-acyltransferase [Rickettsiaceae bacterium]|nr:apolipoprotein N-acyltransferase [Rickettsiaceae bacterium]MDP4832534.1 apolipoprotein N-acyltransferase [Rickettsiaceae bacterium]MDP5020224.1 apolipoprotein N-acyltransferase [Rickettsiaceae bacterium]MDP5083507.1 apolipoprotein N-acyltransferase [Rickettsiaceae bacterium]